MPPVVSLDVLPADVPAEYAPAMVAACSDAVVEGSCAMASSLPESTRPEAVALVLWQGGEYLQVTVRVGRGDGKWVQRALTFSERDSISERFTTVGLTVATLVGETQPQPEPVAEPLAPAVVSPEPAALPTAAHPAAPPAPQLNRRLIRAQLGVLTGPSWDRGDWQRGGWLSVGFRIPHSPLVLYAFGSYAVSSGPEVVGVELKSNLITAGLGAGLGGIWRAPSIYGAAALEVAARRIDVERDGLSANDAEVPIRLRLSISFPAESQVALFGGAALRIPPGSDDRTDGSRLRGPAVAAEVLAGLEVRL